MLAVVARDYLPPFALDARAAPLCFLRRPLSIREPVGLGFWVLILAGVVQAAVTIFLPLALQVVHELAPLWVGMSYLILSASWTLATFWVSGWSGRRERFCAGERPGAHARGTRGDAGGHLRRVGDRVDGGVFRTRIRHRHTQRAFERARAGRWRFRAKKRSPRHPCR